MKPGFFTAYEDNVQFDAREILELERLTDIRRMVATYGPGISTLFTAKDREQRATR